MVSRENGDEESERVVRGGEWGVRKDCGEVVTVIVW